MGASRSVDRGGLRVVLRFSSGSLLLSEFEFCVVGRITLMRVSLNRTDQNWSFISQVPVFQTMQFFEMQNFNVFANNSPHFSVCRSRMSMSASNSSAFVEIKVRFLKYFLKIYRYPPIQRVRGFESETSKNMLRFCTRIGGTTSRLQNELPNGTLSFSPFCSS